MKPVSPSHRRFLPIIAVAAIISLSFTGCLGGNNDSEMVTATITFDFVVDDSMLENKGMLPSIHPGNLTIWEMVDEQWIYTTSPNDGITVWIFRNLTSESDVLSLVRAASEVGGFSIRVVKYAGMGSFVVEIGGVENGKIVNGWQYDVNGDYATVAADKHSLSDGDLVMWRFSESPW